MKEEERRAGQIQTWTSTIHGLREDIRTQTPHKALCKVSLIQCRLCSTYRIPALNFCYRCFPGVAVNHIVESPADGGEIDFQCKICFTKRSMITEIRQHGFNTHIPQEHVDYRYPFFQSDLRVIPSRDEDRYNDEVRPRTLPLKEGICILREPFLSDPDGAAGLNWYNPPPAPSADWRVPLSAPQNQKARCARPEPAWTGSFVGIQAVQWSVATQPWRP